MIKLTHVLYLFSSLCILSYIPLAYAKDDIGNINITVLYHENSEGLELKRGAEEAIAEFKNNAEAKELTSIHFSVTKYQAFKRNTTHFDPRKNAEQYNIIFGLTDKESTLSDFINIKGLEKGHIVISPLIMESINKKKEKNIFSTNLDISSRSSEIYGYINHKEIDAIAVFYRDTPIGRAAEKRFKSELSSEQNRKYQAFIYGDNNEVRTTIRKIYQTRPAAIGIFGSAMDVSSIVRQLRNMNNTWFKYDPYIFSNIDLSSLQFDDAIKYYTVLSPSLVKEKHSNINETSGISYDSMSMILAIIQNNALTQLKPEKIAVVFESEFHAHMEGSKSYTGKKTNMRFHNYQNTAIPSIMQMKAQVISTAEFNLARSSFNLSRVYNRWKEVRKKQYGKAPYISLLLIVFFVLIITFIDLAKSHDLPIKRLKHPPFILLMLFNVLVACGVFTYLCEKTEIAQWNNFVGAIVVALGFNGLLKTNIFQSKGGKSIGLKSMYDFTVNLIYSYIQKETFRRDVNIINYIAYANSKKHLMESLQEFYDFDIRKDHREEKKKQLLDELNSIEGTLESRKYLAKRIQVEIDERKLREKKILPIYTLKQKRLLKKSGNWFTTYESSNYKSLHDPEAVIQSSTKYCLHKIRIPKIDLAKKVDKLTMEINSSELRNKINSEVEDELKQSSSTYATYSTYIRWHLLLSNYNIRAMIEEGLLPRNTPFLQEVEEDERRINDRKSPSYEAEVFHLDNKSVEVNNFQGKLLDISKSGACLSLECENKPLQKKSSIQVTVNEGRLKGFSADGEIKRVTKPAKNNVYHIGIEWKNQTIENKNKLGAYLSQA